MNKHFILKSFLAATVALSLCASACQFGKKEFAALTEADLTAFAETMPDQQKRQLAQNPQGRKGMIDQFKKMFAFAQAGLAEGLDKSDDYTNSLRLESAKVLAQEHGKRNEGFQVSKADIDGYVAAHQKDFDSDVAFFTRNAKEKPTGDQLESLKASWGELMFRADKGRQTGLEKDLAVQIQLKMMRGNLLANLYSRKVEEKFKTGDKELQDYYAQHPEADPDKIKQRVGDLLARIKKGETFEKIADEVNEDGTKGRGGDLDWFGKGTMDPDFEKAAYAMQTGQISQEPVKSSFGYHLIKVEGRRKAAAKPAVPPGTPGSSLNEIANKNSDPNAEEVHAKHIYLSTKKAEDELSNQGQQNIKRVMEDATLKFPVVAPEDFKLTVAGLRPPSGPLPPGAGQGGSMKMITPNESK
ncbi:MAG: peptidyl-prolyl cis-trans isomerase [Acidobacteria bacterium]|nr:peptidyl-prolyl cis-trans isomerase [Acidobacteriota bacterium]MBI3425994.1 peptidyl-prolyl cis-trans isomerase [Acidobacteriota bacterium]